MMKKVLLLALALVLPTASLADNVAAGAWEVKGASTLGFDSNTFKDDASGNKLTTSTFKLDTGAAYYLNPSFGVGLEVSYDKTTEKLTGFDSVSTTTWTIGPKLVFDHSISPNTSFFAEGMLGLMKAESGTSSLDGWGFGLGAGVKYFFARSVSADVGLRYLYAKVEDEASNKGTMGDLSLSLGFSVYFNNAGH